MGMDWPKMGFPTPFPAKYGLRIIIRKTYFYQKMGLYPIKIYINNTEKKRPDLPVSAVALPSPYLSSRRGLRPKYFLRKIVKIVNFRKIVKSNPMPFLKGQLQGICRVRISYNFFKRVRDREWALGAGGQSPPIFWRRPPRHPNLGAPHAIGWNKISIA